MKREQTSALKAGIFVLVGGILLVAGIAALGQRRQLFAPQYRLKTSFSNVAGLIRGAAVRVSGVNVGSVSDIQIIPLQGKPGQVEVTIEVAREYQNYIRPDSRAMLRTVGVIGDKYVEVTIGTANEPPLTDGSVLAAQEVVDFYDLAEQARQAVQRVNTIAGQVADTLGQLNRGKIIEDLGASASSLRSMLDAAKTGPGLAHSAFFDKELPKALDDLRATSAALRASAEIVQQGKGPLGVLLHSEKVAQGLGDAAEAMSGAKGILKQIEKGDGAAHALIYEPGGEPLTQIGSAAKRLDSILTRVDNAQGTLGLFISDPSIWESLKRLFGAAEESAVLRHVVRSSMKE